MTLGKLNLAADNVDTRNLLRDRVLHLDARIHFDKVYILIAVHEKLDGAGIAVADVTGYRQSVVE
jgi:hypothetical protein